jgi:hypothetical protein
MSEKVIWIIKDVDNKIEVKTRKLNYSDEDYTAIRKVNGLKITDTSKISEEILREEYWGDGITIEYRVKLGCFSEDMTQLWEEFDSMSAIHEDMKTLCLEEINDLLYTAYIEEKWVENEEHAQWERRQYEADMRNAYYS